MASRSDIMHRFSECDEGRVQQVRDFLINEQKPITIHGRPTHFRTSLPASRKELTPYVEHACADAMMRTKLSIILGLPTDDDEASANAARSLQIAEQSLEVSRESAAASKASAQAAARTAAATWILAGVTLVLAVIPVLSYCDSRDSANQRQAEQDGQHGDQGDPSAGKTPSGFGIAPAGQDTSQENQQEAKGQDGP